MPSPLFEFAWFPGYDAKIDYLASLAQPENWNYRHATSTHPNAFLSSYLHYTFGRIQEQNKIAISPTNSKACFNTGLVTANQEEIFAAFVPHQSQDAQPWFFGGFFRESDRELLDFGQLPQLATYVTDPADLLYDTRLPLRKNVDHIIDDNKERFPEPFRSMQDNYQLRIALDGAIAHSVRRIERNYRTAVPQFYQGRIQLLLPLCMTNRTTADLALVVYRQNDVYLASTCLTLDMAYNNARLLARPDSDWLDP
ncbi:MAG TPA: DUF3825 domain-containing protein [Verrucomicrobiae bacterium]|jgi:hypothetical protein